MFQFPGFALKPLCVQGNSTWFSLLGIACAIHNRLSGGFPHSEIHGSKPVLGSPWLIAEYHVLHRLLLPRHPPNALLALDLIRRKADLSPFKSMYTTRNEPQVRHVATIEDRRVLVSVLDLDNAAVGRVTILPSRGQDRQR